MDEELKVPMQEPSFSINFSDGNREELIVVKSKHIFILADAYKDFLSNKGIPFEVHINEREKDSQQLDFLNKLEEE